MSIKANDPARISWLPVSPQSDFPIQNIPFGVFLTRDDVITIGTRIGDTAIDLGALHQLGYFSEIPLTDDIFLQDTLNDFISDGKKTWRAVRNRIAELFDKENDELQHHEAHKKIILFSLDEIEMQLPVQIGDYTDFYSSREHATNVGKMFRDPENALLPNWLHLPVGYHGRSSTIVPSGTPVRRPYGQTLPKDSKTPVFGPSARVDFELEMAFITTDANKMGEAIPVAEAEDYIFGLVLFNDWSARDIQKWEYVPLGPFLAKSFASSISPWMGSGTISGKTEDSFGSMLELSWMGTRPLKLKDGETRTFLKDMDTVVMRGYCQNKGLRIGFGEVRSQLLPALSPERFQR
ncbi:MAG: fumarylacetoacetate hydrolase family protein [Robiginitalea sp.]